MTVAIKGLNPRTLTTLDNIFIDLWREETHLNSDGTYDIQLNDAWMEIKEGEIYIIYEGISILLFRDLFVEIIIA